MYPEPSQRYDYKPDHYRFPRSCENFEPAAISGDYFVWRASVRIVIALVLLEVIAYFVT